MEKVDRKLIIFNDYEERLENDSNTVFNTSLSESDRYGVFASLISFAAVSDIPYETSSSNKNEKRKFLYNWSEKKILIVEDDDANYLLLEYILKKTNIKVLRAIDGIEAVRICREEEDIDIILMDIQLPLMDGYDASSEIRTFRNKLPIIAQTAYAMHTDRKRCFECGCNEFLTKPIDKDNLLNLINNYLKA